MTDSAVKLAEEILKRFDSDKSELDKNPMKTAMLILLLDEELKKQDGLTQQKQ